MRKTLPVIAAATTVLALAACSSSAPSASPTPKETKQAASDCPRTTSGTASDSITVSGDFRAAPKVDIPSPLKTTDTERSMVIKGTGKAVKDKTTVDVAIAAYSGTTGKQLMSTGFDQDAPVPISVDDTQFIPGIVCSIEGVPLHSRVVTTSTVKDAFAGKDATDLGLKPTDSVVFVVDVIALAPKVPSKADGKPQSPKPGFPTVKLADDGSPTMTIPKSDPPAKTEIEVLKQGDGATVASGDTATVQYQGVNWRTGKVFDQSWGKQPVQMPTTGVIPGFSKAMVGQKVGSQVLVVVAPDDGYGPNGGQSDAGIKATDTIVFVIDILATTK